MRNFPMFTTEWGIGELTLSEIPYSRRAYIRIRTTEYPDRFLSECCAFCRSAGAETIYACGHSFLEHFPTETEIWQMKADKHSLGKGEGNLFPVTVETVSLWQEIFNRRMADIPSASYLTMEHAKNIIQKGEAYYVHQNKEIWGIGVVSGDEIKAVASSMRGKGEQTLLTLAQLIQGDIIHLEVASCNQRAVNLYERLGFLKCGISAVWKNVTDVK